ncbi:transglycosylase domain-containing protein [Streptomyces orinoci]|uniref:Transglycosylase domain-containing protein n=1 Tax=Streptomyces orinoci TaxID=67339 RepID=A0ABV3JSH5_STRON|nr:transglycosylase domain-containing protein [Streptomyces orinoci]
MGRAEARRAQKGRGARSARGKKPKKTGIRRFFTWKKLLAYFFGLILLGMGAFAALYFSVDVPASGNSAAVAQSNVYRLPNGKVLARSGKFNREEVAYAKIPANIKDSVVAAENKNFWTDPGIDFMGTSRGILYTLMGKGTQGGSTITQQYVKNYYLDQRQTVQRKVKELIISLKLQQTKSKEDILAGYLNTSFFGRNSYGIQAASHAYFNKELDKLSIEESAYLAALLQSPSSYDVVVGSPAGKAAAIARWNYVLDKLVEMHKIPADKRKTMQFPKVIYPKADPGLDGQKGYIVAMARDQASQILKAQGRDLAAGGYTITVTIDDKKQKALENAVKAQMTDQLEPKTRKADRNVQAGAVSVDPRSGQIAAIYGGPGETGPTPHWISNATRSDFQPGSTFKPLIYTAALKNGSKTQTGQPINANTIYDGTNQRPVVNSSGEKVGYAPENENHINYGPVTVQSAMNQSINSVFAQMAQDVGLHDVKTLAGDMGMNTKDPDFVEKPAMALGSMGASPLEMAGVYATLDAHGKKVSPTIIKSINWKGTDVDLPKAVGSSEPIDRNTADGVTSLLQGVVNDEEGTGNVVKSDRYQVAGKTGTSEEDRSAWFTGYTPDLVTSVGLFGESPEGKHVSLYGVGSDDPTKRVNGGGMPAKIWDAYTSAALGDDATPKFDLETEDGPATATPPPPTATAPPSHVATTPPASHSPSPTHTQPSVPPTNTHTASPSHTPPSHRPLPTPTDPTGIIQGNDNGGPGGDPGTNSFSSRQ